MTSLVKRVSIDWVLIGALIPLIFSGLLTMKSFTGDSGLFVRQLIWVSISSIVLFVLSFIDFRFLRRTEPIVFIYGVTVLILSSLFVFGKTVKGSTSWLEFGLFSFQPSDLAKLALILVLAKYFSKRHVEIANIRHILVSGLYAGILCFLVLLQPDLGSAVIIFLVWFGMVLVSGISKKHLISVFLIGIISFGLLWQFAFKEYQKKRIMTFINPTADIRGAGYNAYQSTIAVGSGELFGKGIGYGTQSRLNYLPEYETDFIFAAFAEEWGFVGVLFLCGSFLIVMIRILQSSILGETNFEILFGTGLAIFFMSHFMINVGMNMGLMPVTGIPLPFVSYGGSHLLISFAALGILMGMRRYRRAAHKEIMKNEFVGM